MNFRFRVINFIFISSISNVKQKLENLERAYQYQSAQRQIHHAVVFITIDLYYSFYYTLFLIHPGSSSLINNFSLYSIKSTFFCRQSYKTKRSKVQFLPNLSSSKRSQTELDPLHQVRGFSEQSSCSIKKNIKIVPFVSDYLFSICTNLYKALIDKFKKGSKKESKSKSSSS